MHTTNDNMFFFPAPCERGEAIKTEYYIYQGSWEGMQSSVLILLERVTLMSTYEEFMVILTVAMLIVAILNYKK